MFQRQQHMVMQTVREDRVAGAVLVVALHVALLGSALWHFAPNALQAAPPVIVAVLPQTPPPPPDVLEYKPLKFVAPSVDIAAPDVTITADPQPAKLEGRVVVPPVIVAAPPPVAVAPPSPAADMGPYLALVSARIQRFLQLPGEMQGTVLVHLRFGSDGKVSLAELAKTSGNVQLDREALAVIWRAQPMPPIPPELKLDRINGIIPVQFRLRGR